MNVILKQYDLSHNYSLSPPPQYQTPDRSYSLAEYLLLGFSARSDLLVGAGVDLVGTAVCGLTPDWTGGFTTGDFTGVVGGVTNDPGSCDVSRLKS